MANKVLLWSGIALFASTLALAGCGKKEEPAPPPAPAEQAAPPAEGMSSEAAPANPCAPAQPETKEEGTKTN